MKTTWRFFLSACMAFACVLLFFSQALSEAWPPAETFSHALKGTPYEGFVISRCCPVEAYGTAYVIASNEGKNVLCVFAKTDGQWQMRIANENALYDGSVLPTIYWTGVISFVYNDPMPVLAIEFYSMYSEELDSPLRQVYTFFGRSSTQRQWPLRIHSLGREGDKNLWKVDGFCEDKVFSGWANMRLSDFDIGVFPTSVEEALHVWQLEASNDIEFRSDADLLQMVPYLGAIEVELPAGQSFDVYSGPGTHYRRGANGKARVSTNESFRVYGTTEDWALISYKINQGKWDERYGYIPASVLPSNPFVLSLRKTPVNTGYVRIDTTALRDIPDGKSEPLRTLKRGDEVTVIAALGDWIYVDDSPTNPHSPGRGFIWFDDVTFANSEWIAEYPHASPYQEGAFEDQDTANPYRPPDTIAVVFADARWDGYHPVYPTWYTVESGYQNGKFYPVIMKNGERNVLCVLEKLDGVWAIAFTNEHALFSGDTLPENISYYFDPHIANYDGYYDQSLTISYTFEPPRENIAEVNYLFACYEGIWKIRIIQVFHPVIKGTYVGGMDYRETKISPSDGSLIYGYALNEKDLPPTDTLAFASSFLLKEFDINSIPLAHENSPFK